MDRTLLIDSESTAVVSCGIEATLDDVRTVGEVPGQNSDEATRQVLVEDNLT